MSRNRRIDSTPAHRKDIQKQVQRLLSIVYSMILDMVICCRNGERSDNSSVSEVRTFDDSCALL
jgi:phosphate uptake regulator